MQHNNLTLSLPCWAEFIACYRKVNVSMYVVVIFYYYILKPYF